MQLHHAGQSANHIAGDAVDTRAVARIVAGQQAGLGYIAEHFQASQQDGFGPVQVSDNLGQFLLRIVLGNGGQPSVMHQIPQGHRHRPLRHNGAIRIVRPAAGHHLQQEMGFVAFQERLPFPPRHFPQILGNAYRQDAFHRQGIGILELVAQLADGIAHGRRPVLQLHHAAQAVGHIHVDVGNALPILVGAVFLGPDDKAGRGLLVHRIGNMPVQRPLVHHHPVYPLAR